ncbi:hypothetical protein AMELA_G00200400 [Ameiurus melas]|uniref:Uncharacterized protein n=1 Tax=Ameiurus melas TaxID=219545 RepID=A0A7J6AAN7_AMEME|nr:hypothetical protein AMELA_G00200400 [Ameiurus melas]
MYVCMYYYYYYYYYYYWGNGDLVVTTFASHLWGWGFESLLHPVFPHPVFPRASGVSSLYFGFLLLSTNMCYRLIGVSKLSIVCERVPRGPWDMLQTPLQPCIE